MFKVYYKNALCVLFLIIASTPLFSQNVGINTTGATPSSNAILDLNTGNTSYNLGFTLPYVRLSASLSTFGMAGTATNKDTGMFVYNTSATHQAQGLYYWSGNSWVLAATTGGILSSAPIDPQWVNGGAMTANTYYVFYGYTSYNNETPATGTNVHSATSATAAAALLTSIAAYQHVGLVATSNGAFSKAFLWVNPSASGTLTVYACKITPATSTASGTLVTGATVLGSGSSSAMTSGKTYSVEITASTTNSFSKGDIIVLVYMASAALSITDENGTIEVAYQ